jgi:DHA1 family multidrug resistance protein-like MFS transporter
MSESPDLPPVTSDPEDAPTESLGREASGSQISTRQGPIAWRRNLNAIFVSQLLAIVAFSLRAPFLPFFLGDLGLDSTEAQALWSGYINAAGAGVMAITAPLWGLLADKRGRKPMLLRAQLAAFCTIGLMGLATEPWHLLALRMIEGALTGTVVAATALVATSMPKERLGFGLGLIQTAVFSGSALGPLVGGLLADSLGYRVTFGIASGMMLSGALVTLFLVHERFVRQPKMALGAKPERIWRLLLAPALLSLAGVMLIIRFASSAIQPIMPLFVEELAKGLSNTSSLAGITLGILGVTSAISSIFLGKLGDKRGHRQILIISTLGSGLIYLPMAMAQNPWQLIGLQAIFGIFAGGMIPAANALIAAETAPERRGVVYGLMAAAQSVGGFIGPLAGAGFAAWVGFRYTFAATGIVLLGLFVALTFIWRKPVTPEEFIGEPA